MGVGGGGGGEGYLPISVAFVCTARVLLLLELFTVATAQKLALG